MINDTILLNKIIEDEKKKRDEKNTMQDSVFFEVFVSDQILKYYDLSYDELLDGRVGGGNDGGIDNFFIFLNDSYTSDIEDVDIDNIKKQRSATLRVFLIQAKNTESFEEKPLNAAIAAVKELFNLSTHIDEIDYTYNKDVIKKSRIFQKLYLNLSTIHPMLEVSYLYVTKGDRDNIHPNVKQRAENLKSEIQTLLREADVNVAFYGAKELIEFYRKKTTYSLELEFVESPIARGDNGYIILTTLESFFNFIKDEDGKLRKYIFESNVRDYQGNVEVNRNIEETLSSEDENLDFWWLNNGITILSSKASIIGKKLTLDDVQIVNGLQTAVVIYNYFTHKKERNNIKRTILIRVIVTENPETRDRIIKATNFQTSIPPASFRATEKIQRDIEDYFYKHNWFYDRRKSYYKNEGKPINKIISIPYLAQSVTALILKEPEKARSRPSSLVKSDKDYSRIFNEEYPLHLYLFCAKFMRKIDQNLRNNFPEYPIHEKNNLRFHIGMVALIKLLSKKEYSVTDLSAMFLPAAIEDDKFIEKVNISDSVKSTIQIARKFATRERKTIELISKSRNFVEYLLDNLEIETK